MTCPLSPLRFRWEATHLWVFIYFFFSRDTFMLKTTRNISGVAPVQASGMDRFNPYRASEGYPVRAQLLSSHETCTVTRLKLQPGATFSFYTYSSASVT